MKRLGIWALVIGLLASATSEPADAQLAARRFTTIEGLRRFSSYFHLQNVVLRGEFAEASNRRVVLRGGDSEMQVMLNDVTAADGPVEVRGQLIDVGRLTATDPRLARYEHRPDPEHWPMPGEELLLSVSAVAKAEPVATPTVRALALEPWRFETQAVTVTGQFGGRNLFGDLPAAPAKTKYDFVLRNSEGAVWVTGLRPKGKGFDLNVDARVDTSQWLQITGTVKRERGLVVMEARTMLPTSAPATRVVIEEAPPPPKEPGEVVFSSPTDGETNVSVAAPVRLQFSRGVDPSTLTARLRVGYVEGPTPSPEASSTIDAKISYDAGTRAVELRFSKPLDAFRSVKVELLEGITTFDGAPIKPWTVTFSLGGN